MSHSTLLFFFFSSRRRHTRFDCDWSSDVCSSDLGTAIIVALGGLWATSAPAIYALLAGGAIVVFVVHDVLPSLRLGGAVLVFEAVTAIALFPVLIVLTGGVDSPFFFGYYLIAAAAAFVVGGTANFLLAAAISAVYLLALLLLQGAPPPA